MDRSVKPRFPMVQRRSSTWILLALMQTKPTITRWCPVSICLTFLGGLEQISLGQYYQWHRNHRIGCRRNWSSPLPKNHRTGAENKFSYETLWTNAATQTEAYVNLGTESQTPPRTTSSGSPAQPHSTETTDYFEPNLPTQLPQSLALISWGTLNAKK